ncbi:PhzF family phenazine biosynthesis protein [uncultured Vibrio sp.]|uniref:PhzF family phenazine biosynthesis protein n=1 Tax=uncultured Vibrio sp. TaxID=114054 RepID=UPI0025D9CE69|nr:PhzF family phenazine biosynthesis protein [uncultured Vibrio sp.]
MHNIDAHLVSSFTFNGTGGNPAGVVLHADNLSHQEKLKIAQAVGYSETAFVSQDSDADFGVSFFTVTDEVDFCGHATLAAFSTMHQQGVISAGQYTQKTKAGLLAVTVEPSGKIVMEQALPEYLGALEYNAVSPLIGIDSTILKSSHLPIEIVSTGLPDIIVPVPFGYLDKVQVNEPLLSEFCKVNNVIGIHAFELCKESNELTASCRNFAPLFGIPEESATGSASGALASYLTKHINDDCTKPFTFEQGKAMGCISRITASVESNGHSISKVLVGGFADNIGLKKIKL